MLTVIAQMVGACFDRKVMCPIRSGKIDAKYFMEYFLKHFLNPNLIGHVDNGL